MLAVGLPSDKSADTSVRWRIDGLASLNVFHAEPWRQVTGGEIDYNPAVDDAIGDSSPRSARNCILGA